MLEALFASRFPDGLKRRLHKQWGQRIPGVELDECVAVAIDAAYQAAGDGKASRDLGAWLWKVANNTAHDKWTADYGKRDASFDGYDDIEAEPETSSEDRAAADALAEHRRKEALRLAREMLPRIGTGQIVDVMELVIDAASRRDADLSAATIADVLGISEAAARTLTSRGLARLRREAEKAGVEFPEEISDVETDEWSEDRA